MAELDRAVARRRPRRARARRPARAPRPPRARGADLAQARRRSTCATRAARRRRSPAEVAAVTPADLLNRAGRPARPCRSGRRRPIGFDGPEPEDDERAAPPHVVVSSAYTTRDCGVAELEGSMRCPQCGTRDTRVVDSRDLDEATTIRRRRECPSCTTRFTTYERVEAARLIVVKRDGTRQEFDRDKLADGLAQGADPPAGRRGRRRPRRGRDRGRAALVRPVRDPELADRRAGHGAAAGARPHRLHPVRLGLPELRGPRGPQARGRLAVCRGGGARRRRDARDERPRRPRHPRGARVGPGPDRPLRPGGPPAVVGRPPPRPQLPGVPQQPLRVHRPADARSPTSPSC